MKIRFIVSNSLKAGSVHNYKMCLFMVINPKIIPRPIKTLIKNPLPAPNHLDVSQLPTGHLPLSLAATGGPATLSWTPGLLHYPCMVVVWCMVRVYGAGGSRKRPLRLSLSSLASILNAAQLHLVQANRTSPSPPPLALLLALPRLLRSPNSSPRAHREVLSRR